MEVEKLKELTTSLDKDRDGYVRLSEVQEIYHAVNEGNNGKAIKDTKVSPEKVGTTEHQHGA